MKKLKSVLEQKKRRYYSFSEFLKKQFGEAVYKISIDAGFSCPNRDGTKGINGCAFCNNDAFSPARKNNLLSVKEQLNLGIRKFKERRKNIEAFMAYFQAFSNTYASEDKLRELYSKALEVQEVVSIAVGTRPDCINEEVIKVLKEFSTKTHFWLELGLESSHNQTLERVNRGHCYEDFLRAFKELRKIPDLKICVHLIHGLPAEDKSMMLETVKRVNALCPDAVKFHQLEIVKDTEFEKEYKKGNIKLLSIDEYLDILGESLKLLDKNIVIQRLFGFTPSNYLIAPQFEEKINFHQLVNSYLEDTNIYQGENCV